jgi:hypothetical protein
MSKGGRYERIDCYSIENAIPVELLLQKTQLTPEKSENIIKFVTGFSTVPT